MASFLDKGTVIRKVLDFIFDRIDVIFEVLGVVAVGLSGYIMSFSDSQSGGVFFNSNQELVQFRATYQSGLLWGPIVILVIGIIARAVTMKAVSKLESMNEKLQLELRSMQSIKDNLEVIVNHLLYAIARELSFTPNERVSFYIKRKNKDNKTEFALCGRYSPSESYNKPGRSSYPLNEGVIGKAWDTGEFETSEFPDWADSADKYISICHDKFGMKAKSTRKLAMHPRYMYARRIGNADGREYKSIIVIESNSCDFSHKNEIKRVVDAHQSGLFEFARDFHSIMPAVSRAKEMGL